MSTLTRSHISNAVVSAPGEVTVDTICPCCAGMTTQTLPLEGYTEWLQGGVLIQNALPQLDEDQREHLMSGICPKCWDATFGE